MKIRTSILAIAALATAAGGTTALADDADGVRALVAEMIADAESRSSLLQSGGTAGHDGHFFLSSADGNFTLKMSGQSQTRYTANFNDEVAPRDDSVFGFSLPRTMLRWEGQIYGEFGYAIQGYFSPAGGGFMLEDAYVHTDIGDGMTLYWGQGRTGFMTEDALYEQDSLAVDRSVVDAVFGQGRSQGIALAQQQDEWSWEVAFTDGFRSANSDFGASPADFALTARVDFKAAGSWDQFRDFTSARGSEYGAKLGGAIHFQDGPDTPASSGTKQLAYTIDGMAEGDGWNCFIAFVGTDTEVNGGASSTDFGWLVQGGVFVSDDWELFGRFDMVSPDSNRANNDDFSTITLGANYYMHGQAAKLSFDLCWYLNETDNNDLVNGTAAGFGSALGSSLGLLPSAEKDMVAIRAQFQLLF
ncbi:MAG: hypothetical protein H6813_00790 [Phycisphaeraceae bacterium]|nr:hypothetical protein [Phycisphaeraceae bacterium]MCB9847378.1 hypothetical protein [Phycisphaeraceae bacterium]